MDFEKTLDAWEREQQKKKSRKAREVSSSLDDWIDRHPPIDKDKELDRDREAELRRTHETGLLRRMEPQRSIDLHGMTVEQGIDAVKAFLAEAKRDGLRKVLLIHGKGHHSGGDSVLRRGVRDYLNRTSLAGRSGSADRADGGSGATWVILR